MPGFPKKETPIAALNDQPQRTKLAYEIIIPEIPFPKNQLLTEILFESL